MSIIIYSYTLKGGLLLEENLPYYHIFYTVAREKSISKAANTLFISQPAVSKAVRKLEESMDTVLFQRNSRGVTLTGEGEVLFSSVRSAFKALENGEHQLKQMHNLDMGHIRFGASTTLCKYLLIPYLQTFIREYPHIKLSISCHSSNQTVRLLKEGNLDIGLIGNPSPEKEVRFFPVLEIEDIFVSSRAYLKNLHLEEDFTQSGIFDAATVLLLDKENMTRQYIDDYLVKNQIHPSHLLEISTMDLLIEFAKIGLGAACVIKNFVKKELESGELLELPLQRPIPKREIGFACGLKAPLSLAAERFLSYL